MALSYLRVDRDQSFLLPPSMREWLPEGHLAWFVLDVVERLDTSVLHARHRKGWHGRRAYDPDMLLAVLLYAYCMGVRSSRQIERLCVVDVAFRVLAAGRQPDHTTIARFRQHHEQIAQQLFVDVLTLCAEAGLVRLGVVAIDGTKVEADASMKANRTREKLEAEVAKMFADAAERDAAEDAVFGDARGDELPEELADPRRRCTRLDAALKVLEEQRRQRQAEAAARQKAKEQAEANAAARGRRVAGRAPTGLEVERAEATVRAEEARMADMQRRWEERAAKTRNGRAGGKRPKGDDNVRLRRARERLAKAQERAAQQEAEDRRADKGRANVTDPDSRIMKRPSGWVQGYNAQAAVAQSGIVLAAHVTQDAGDVGQCQPMMTATGANLGAAGITDDIGVCVFDAGYLSDENLTAADFPDRLIATGKSWKLRKAQSTTGDPPEDATPVEAMEHRLCTPEGRDLYGKRQHTVEPVFGNAKQHRGFRRFARRGLAAVDAEWKLAMSVHNILKLFNHGTTNLA